MLNLSGSVPLHINIPDANSPNKFLPSDPKLDTSDFLQSLGGGAGGVEGAGDEPEEFYAQSFIDMDRTCRDEVTMCRKNILTNHFEQNQKRRGTIS